MTLDKHCLSPGCTAPANFGFGSLLKGVMRWACGKHRHQLSPSQPTPAPSRPPTDEQKAKQGVLL